MKTHVKCGLLTALGWNILLFIAFYIRAMMKGVSIDYFFDDGIGGWGIMALLIIWSLIWYAIGAHIRKEFLTQKEQYRIMFPLLEKGSLQSGIQEVLLFQICQDIRHCICYCYSLVCHRIC